MSIVTIIIGESGTGKSASLRDLPAGLVDLIQVQPKPLPFRATGWAPYNRTTGEGNIYSTDKSEVICRALRTLKRPVVVIDDWQYILANEFMERSDEKGFEKFTDIGRHAWDILRAAAAGPANQRVYILAHSSTDELGRTRIKTIGKLLDEKITVEGMVTICLRTHVEGGEYRFATQNNGHDTVKSPMGMFEDRLIPNDLNAVDAAICDYYGIKRTDPVLRGEKPAQREEAPATA